MRCKTKKKGCSRGSPCERCALAGLTADDCVYLEGDATFRSTKPKRTKDSTNHLPKAQQTTKVPKVTLAQPQTDPNTIVRCSRCIRTARGCSHDRPCQPCREGGLSEWECRYTSASSFKVRGPGARDLRKVKSLERISDLASGVMVGHEDEDEDDSIVERVLKQERSHSTNSAPTARYQLMLDQIPRGYRTPSPPTNISPISETSSTQYRERTQSPLEARRTTTAQAEAASGVSLGVPIPGSRQKFVATVQGGDPTIVSRPDGTTGLSAGSVDPPLMMTLIPSVSQQSHANTIAESSPAVYTDDYQSSPSPFNSPQFQSSPPIHFQTIGGSSSGGGGGGTNSFHRPSSFPGEVSMFPPQTAYRPPAGYATTLQGQARQYAAAQAQHGFVSVVPLSSPQQGRQYLSTDSTSPPYPQQMPFHNSHQQHMVPYAPQQQQQQGTRHRAVPVPSPRFASPGPYAIPSRPGSYQGNQAGSFDGRASATQQSVPIRIKGHAASGAHPHYGHYGLSPSDSGGGLQPGDALAEFKNQLSRQASYQTSEVTHPLLERDVAEEEQQQQQQQDFVSTADFEWQDDIGVFGQPTPHE